MYTQIEGMMAADEAADALVFHAKNIADAIKRNDNCFFENREASVKAVLKLLGQYVGQERLSSAAGQPIGTVLIGKIGSLAGSPAQEACEECGATHSPGQNTLCPN